MRRLRFFLDANIVVDAQLRDLFLTASEFGVIDVAWTPQILSEAKRALVDRLDLPLESVNMLLAAMDQAFPEASFAGDIPELDAPLPDPDDNHVLAAAISSSSDFLVTNNLRDFPSGSVPHQVELDVLGTEDALTELVAAAGADATKVIVAEILHRMTRPAMTIEEYLKRLELRAPIATLLIGSICGLEGHKQLWVNTMESEATESPFQAVRELVDLLRTQSTEGLLDLLHPTLVAEIQREESEPAPVGILKVLTEGLSDVLEGDDWGFPTNPRPVAPGVEIVKFLRVGPVPLLVHEPTLAEGHIFKLVHEGGRWRIIEIDFDDPGLSGYLSSGA